MRKYENHVLYSVACNRCGKSLTVENGILKEGCFHGERIFDYFSEKDGEKQVFDLCDACYDALIDAFVIPVERREETELL